MKCFGVRWLGSLSLWLAMRSKGEGRQEDVRVDSAESGVSKQVKVIAWIINTVQNPPPTAVARPLEAQSPSRRQPQKEIMFGQ